MKILLLFSSMLMSTGLSNVFGQASYATVREEMKKIYKAYLSDGLLELTINTSLYSSADLQKKIDSTEGNYYIQGDKVLGNISDGTSYLHNGKWTVMVINESKQMYIDSSGAGKMEPKVNPLQILDSLAFDSVATYTIYTLDTNTNAIKAVLPPGGEIIEGTMIYNSQTHQLIQASYIIPYVEEYKGSSDTSTYTPPPPGSMYYLLKLNYSSVWKTDYSDVFNERRYFRKEGDHYLPTDAFKDFNIVTQFNEEDED